MFATFTRHRCYYQTHILFLRINRRNRRTRFGYYASEREKGFLMMVGRRWLFSLHAAEAETEDATEEDEKDEQKIYEVLYPPLSMTFVYPFRFLHCRQHNDFIL